MKEPKTPRTVDSLTTEYLSIVAAKLLRDPTVTVTGFTLTAEPFEFPRFGDKQFFEIAFDYSARKGGGRSTIILRVLPPMDAVMMLTGDTEHRELKAFQTGLFNQVPGTFHIPYVHIEFEPVFDQYWAFVEDVRPEMERLGMHAVIPDETLRIILGHLAAFHAAFWERDEILSLPWLMRLEQPVDYFYRCVVDILDGMETPAQSSVYMVGKWPWLQEGVPTLMDSLPVKTRSVIERLYREPERLLAKVRPLPRTLCHYDFDNRNLGLRDTPDGPKTVVIDWEIVGEGVSSADVVRFMAYQQPPNAEELVGHYLDELERRLGHAIDREQWLYGSELVTIAIWQIIGVLFGVMVNAPSAPVPDDQREAMRERVYSDIAHVESLAFKHGLA
ncbi:MAG: phosphotransferase [Dehalococcoidia bacterium]